MPENSRKEPVNGRWVEAQGASLTTATTEGAEKVDTANAYVPSSRTYLEAVLNTSRYKSTGTYESRQAELWREHEDLRKGFVEDIKAGKSAQEAYDHWLEPTREHNQRIRDFNTEFGTSPKPGHIRESAREFDLDRQRTWAEHMLRRQEARRHEEQMSQGLGMGM